MTEIKDHDTTIVEALINYVKTVNPEGNEWNEVSKGVYFSRIICCLCTLNERFADELDNEVDAYLNDKADFNCQTQYGEIEMNTDVISGETYVSLRPENV